MLERLAGDAAIYEALSRYFESAPAGPPPQQQPTSIARSGAVASEAALESFLQTHALLRSKGYSEDAASDLAQATATGQRPADTPTLRFAAVYGHAPKRSARRG
jgi:hypothetical protein